jgi:GntR family transcriptional regulator
MTSTSPGLSGSVNEELAFAINRSSALPYHEQVYRLMLDEIMSGSLTPGDKVLREKEYAARLGISLAPVRQAFLALARDGYLTRTRGRGTFVRELKVASKIQLLSGFTAALEATGLPVRMRVLAAEQVPAGEAVAEALGLPMGASLFHLRRLAFLAGEPVALLLALLPARLCEGLSELDLTASLYETLERRHGTVMTSARNTIEVVRALPEHSSHLQVPVGEALLQVEAVTHDQRGTPAEFSQVLYRVDRFRFEIESHRSASHAEHGVGGAYPGPPPAPDKTPIRETGP